MRSLSVSALIPLSLLLFSCVNESEETCRGFEPFFGRSSCTSDQTFGVSNVKYLPAGRQDTVLLPAYDGANIFNMRPWQINLVYDSIYVDSELSFNSVHIEFDSVPGLEDTVHSTIGRLRFTSDLDRIVPLHLDSAWVANVSESENVDPSGKVTGGKFEYEFRFAWNGNFIMGRLLVLATPFKPQ